MTEFQPIRRRRSASLSREQIVDAAISLLDSGGEIGLTFRTLAERLATGPGALYGHIANKRDLIVAACNAIISRKVNVEAHHATPQETVRAVALALYDAMDAHPWVGSALRWSAGELTMVRILECLGQQIVALGVPEQARWVAVSSLLNYILGVGGQNAGNAQAAQAHCVSRAALLGSVATTWLQLDPQAYPFTRSVATQMRVHDDRADFLVGLDFILVGMMRMG